MHGSANLLADLILHRPNALLFHLSVEVPYWFLSLHRVIGCPSNSDGVPVCEVHSRRNGERVRSLNANRFPFADEPTRQS